jgi:leader peptidase (prepilin peptidase)/N-methyltransferase
MTSFMELFYFYPWLFPTLATIFALIIGSFLNVVIHRLPIMMEQEWRQECAEAFPDSQISVNKECFNIAVPRSRCPSCETPLRVLDNIPIISWLWLKGHCRYCHQSISARYPLVEALTAILCLIISLKMGFSGYSVALLFFTFTLICAAFIDLDTMFLPDQLTLPLMWAGIALSLLSISPIALADSVIGAMCGYLSLWLVYWGFKLLTGKEGMGYGDFKLLAALGAWLGWQQLPLIILLSSVIGVVFGVIQLRMQRKGVANPFPFGPYLAIAGWLAALWGDELIHYYLFSIVRT